MITGKFPSLRLRRTRKYAWSRKLVQENNLSVSDLIYPIFLIEGKNKKQIIKSMPNIYRYTLDKLGEVVNNVVKNNIPMVALFPSTPIAKKDKYGSEALNENNLVCRATQIIKKRFKNNIGVMCDVALDPYTSHGHDGLLKNNYVMNDETNDILIKQSILQAQMGCDVIAPSDMMDGRIRAIRNALEEADYKNTILLSYAAKYNSKFYGPFRDAVGSKGVLIGDKKNYQMDYRNSDEALREVALDIKEGADMVMVKPGMPYLDIVHRVKTELAVPTFAYQVSGEYAMHMAAIQNGWLAEKSIVMESLLCFKRAGADGILTYFAKRAAQWLKEQNQ